LYFKYSTGRQNTLIHEYIKENQGFGKTLSPAFFGRKGRKGGKEGGKNP